MMKPARWIAHTLLAGVLAGWGPVALSQEFPAKPVRVLVGYAAGGTPDVVARFLGQQMGTTLGQPIVVENRPGAGGLPAVQELLRSAPDGYTMQIIDVGGYAILPAMRPGAYDPVKDLQAIGQATTNAVYITVNNKIPAKTMPEFIALVKSRPGQFSYGSAGIGSLHHLFMEAVKVAFGLDLQHVPYKGSGQSVIALLNGDVPMAIAGPTATQQFVNEGKLRMLAGSTKERDKLAPDVPSAAEFGQPDIDFGGDMGYFAPAGTPRPVVDKLAAALAKAVLSPEFAARVGALGTNVMYRNTDQFAEAVRAAVPRYQRVVKLAGIKPE